ncbi:hypothetical protein [Streptococcus anginosus]|uniref:Uncharacterized protein n=1 Tax=Streptococcus anginosus subsp. whileyi CCUG 39159 TaxID=1095729 RepID=I0S913_STRAP|nr:hypothetical protein [Streptococcus anginosus]EID19866.1 hypothetical protein HMPREF1043_1683 [Streptococcus anginosus subsp. whileyi CCUG 39159]
MEEEVKKQSEYKELLEEWREGKRNHLTLGAFGSTFKYERRTYYRKR